MLKDPFSPGTWLMLKEAVVCLHYVNWVWAAEITILWCLINYFLESQTPCKVPYIITTLDGSILACVQTWMLGNHSQKQSNQTTVFFETVFKHFVMGFATLICF